MTDEEKRFDRREEARLDDMYDAQCETRGDDMTDAFNRWWNADGLIEDNPFNRDTPAFWAWEGWQAALKNSVMTDEEYEQAMADEGQRRMLTFDTEVREMIKEAVEMEREACAALNAEMLNALYAVELWLSSGEGTGFQDKVLAAINKAEGRVLHNLNKAAEANREPL